MNKELLILREKITKPITQHILFHQWIGNLIDVNNKLSSQYDAIYQRYYYVLVVELLNTGRDYLQTQSEKGSDYKTNQQINSCIDRMSELLSKDELLFLVYHRDSSCHIFQDRYDVIRCNGSVKANKKGKDGYDVFEIQQIQDRVLQKYITDRRFADFVVKSFHPIIEELDKILFPK